MYVRFEDGEKYTKKKGEDRELSESLDAFDSAGYVLEDNDLVVDIDCLSHEQILALIEQFNLKTQIVWTDRGAHLYFKKPRAFYRAKGMTALGFPVEYKHPKNTYAITVKLNGNDRVVENAGVRKQLPNFLEPIRSKDNLLGLQEGDNRNDLLYAHKRRIAKFGNTNKILKFINNYIFSEPLPDDEFDVVARDQTFEAEKDGENIVADTIMRENKVVCYNGSLFFLQDDYYTNDENQLNRLVYEYCAGQKTRYVDEVIKQMKYRAEEIPDTKVFKVRLKNGYLYQGQFYPYGYYDFTPYYIDINYAEDAEPVQKVDEYLDNLTDHNPEYRDFVLEVIANALITDHEFKRHLAKFFIFVGDGGNGKGTLLQIITKILGKQNVAANSISELSNERYTSTLVGKLANLGDDIQDEPINRKQMKVLKNLSTGDTIQIRRLYENPIMAQLNPTLIFTSNHILRSFDKDYSYKRRVLWCPMYGKPKVMEPDFITQLTTPKALEYWMSLIVEAYKRLYQNGKYTECDMVENFTDNYHRENDTTIEFVENLSDEQIEFKRPPQIFQDYQAWCESNGEYEQTDKQLKTTILNRGFKVVTVNRKALNNGVPYKCYRKI